jgi:outer membrane protein OmpA-like peptidoglycan-associated protein
MFLFDSDEMAEAEQYYNDLADMLPSAGELVRAEYIVVVSAFFASDEASENLSQLRANAVRNMLIDLGIPNDLIRVHAAASSGGPERYRQRADISFLYIGNK